MFEASGRRPEGPAVVGTAPRIHSRRVPHGFVPGDNRLSYLILMMGSRVRHLTLLATVSAIAVMGCQSMDRPTFAPDLERSLSGGREYASALVATARVLEEVDPDRAIALGYLERLRLGLGSPFRLIEYALSDPRLEEGTRIAVAWALLARTLDGQTYEIDPVALDRAGLATGGARPGIGRHHLELIEGAVTESPDPRGGELAVRLAYTLAASEGSVSRRASGLAAQAAALIGDREIARSDALRVLRAAAAEGADPMALIPQWRVDRRFEVEAPRRTALPLNVERDAMELAPRLAGALRALSPRLATSLPATQPRPTLLSPAAAERLAELASELQAPPQTPIIVGVSVHRRELLEPPRLSAAESEARGRFVERSRTEESLAAEYALLAHARANRDPAAQLATLWAAVALRAYGQEEVWFPGFGGPTARELEDRYGLTSVRFDDDVPPSWRPYYRRMLDQALSDLHRVLPALDLRGLRIHFGETRSASATLAVHDPRSRTIYFPPATSAGTIAHEVAHDLDWQVSLRRYRVRGDYATDRATRLQRDRLAVSLQGLTTAALLPPLPGDRTPPPHATRPAEVFARSVDWFVVAALAREGRMNGYLSSVQDDVLTGYGTVPQPDVSGRAGAALIDVLDEIAPIYTDLRRWYLDAYGPGRALTPYDLARRVLEAPIPVGGLDGVGRSAATIGVRPGPRSVDDEESPTGARLIEEELVDDEVDEEEELEAPAEQIPLPPMGAVARFSAIAEARDAALSAIDSWICRAPGAAYEPSLEAARRRLVARAAGARGRGLALELAEELGGGQARRWVARQFYGAPWPSARVDPLVEPLLAGLVAEARALDRMDGAEGPSAFHALSGRERCAVSALLPSR